MPTLAVSPPVASRTRSRSSSPNAVTLVDVVGVELRGGAQVDEGLVERERLDQGRGRAEHLHHRPAGVAVGVEAAVEERRVRAPGPRLPGGHRGPHPEDPGLVGRGRHHAAAADPADHDRLAAQRGLVPLLDRGEERVEVEVQDGGVRPHRPALMPTPWPGNYRRRPTFRAQAGPRGPFLHRLPPDGARRRRRR